MELFTLDANFEPDEPIESYGSLIWTERYSRYGDFQLQAYNISETISKLPREKPVGIRESNVPMMIEDHKIEYDEEGTPLVTVVGRTYETVLERRWSSQVALPYTGIRPVFTVAGEKESDVAYKVLRLIIGDQERLPSLPAIPPVATLKDAIPEIVTPLPLDYSTATPNTYEIKFQNLYSTLIELVNTNFHGIRAVRPTGPAAGNKIKIEIYNGANLTEDVIFDVRTDQFDKAVYLLSKRGSADVAYVFGKSGVTGGGEIVLKTAAPEPEGLARRVLGVEDTGSDALGTADIRKNRGLVELYKYNATAIFSGEVSAQVAAGYNVDYFLGDIIRLNGDYGIPENVRIAEFIRSSDSTGDKAYPAFETVPDEL